MKLVRIFLYVPLILIFTMSLARAQETTPAGTATEGQPASAGAPEITAVNPARVARGSQVEIKITGQNFVPTARVDFASQGITVEKTEIVSPTEIKVRVAVATFATLGTASVFVTHPDQEQAEAPFEVVAGAEPPENTPEATTAPTSPLPTLQFQLIHNVGGLKFLNPKKPKGTLSVEKGVLRFEEQGKELLKVPLTEVKEIEVNKVAKVRSASFRVILQGGQRWDFYPSSLKRSECAFVAGALQNAMKLAQQK